MNNIKEIKNRIDSVRETRKITNAMYLIASTKVRKAKADLDNTRPYFMALRNEIKRIFRTVNDIDNKYFYPADGKILYAKTYGILVITADKGLAGAYNQNVLKYVTNLVKEHPNTKLYVVGEYGRKYFLKRNIPIEESFHFTAQSPNMYRAREITDILLGAFDRGELGKIFVVYTDAKNSQTEEVKSTRLLPFHRGNFVSDPTVENVEFEFSPSIEVVLDNIMHSYVSGFIYSALVDSYCSEQDARMNAMNSANINAQEILSDLSLEYNRVRQTAITQEITEICAGALAKKGKEKVL